MDVSTHKYKMKMWLKLYMHCLVYSLVSRNTETTHQDNDFAIYYVCFKQICLKLNIITHMNVDIFCFIYIFVLEKGKTLDFIGQTRQSILLCQLRI